jgi:hypothetical protein
MKTDGSKINLAEISWEAYGSKRVVLPMMMTMMIGLYMMADVDGNGAVIIVSQKFDFLYMVSQENEFPYQIFFKKSAFRCIVFGFSNL